MQYYDGAIRLTTELWDCSLPVSMDLYSNCSYYCIYCFSQYCRAAGNPRKDYLTKKVKLANLESIKKQFSGNGLACFNDYFKKKYVVQIGGFSDNFDEYEKKYGLTLEFLKFAKEIDYPLVFSTKSVWWTKDDRYIELFTNQKNWNVKFSIITLNEYKSKRIEIGCPSPKDRLEAINNVVKMNCGGAVLRLRPFIFGVSSDYEELIKRAVDNGICAVSLEFLCLEIRSMQQRIMFKKNIDVFGFDILNFYRKYSEKKGYMRLNRNIKRDVVLRIRDLCKGYGIGFYVSDAHFKELSDGACCCAINDDWNYCRANWSYALQVAKRKGEVRYCDLEPYINDVYNIRLSDANCNLASRGIYYKITVKDLLKLHWNSPNKGHSPYREFGGILVPSGVDDDGNIIYRLNEELYYGK